MIYGDVHLVLVYVQVRGTVRKINTPAPIRELGPYLRGTGDGWFDDAQENDVW